MGILPLMVRLLIDTYRTAEHQPGRSRGELTSQEIKKYVAMCLKPGKSTGRDRCPIELTKTMMDEKVHFVKIWVNEILTEDTSRQRATMNGTILQLHRGGGTNKTLDQRLIDLLNSVYQLLNYVINERLKKNVEPANIKDVASELTCKRCTSSNRKLGDRAREFIGSTLTFKTPSTPGLKQRYGR